MEKLIELLNERLPTSDLYEFYDKIYYKEYCWGEIIKIIAKIRQKYKATGDRDADMTHLICLKKYEFIKWLVGNDKIDTFRILEKRFDTQKWYEREHYHTVNEWNTDLLLMLLAISDNPIDFLIQILK